MAQITRQAKKHVVVVGAGIAGLSCAFKLRESDAYKEDLITVTVLEAGCRAGGIIETTGYEGCVLESGPDSFITNTPYMVQLAERLGIGGRIIPTEQTNRGAMVLSNGRLVKLPEGFSLLAPTKILPFLESPIMSWPGKMRVMLEPFLPVRTASGDESLADFVRRRFGRELLARIAQPMVGGIYVGDAEKLSASMTAERFVALEQSSGSVIGGLMKKIGTASSAESSAHGVRYGLFCSFDQGMGVLTDTLLENLEGVDIRLSTPVLAVERDRAGWQVKLTEGQIQADHVVLALPARKSAGLLQASAPQLANHLAQIEAASSVVVNFILAKKDIPVKFDAFGLVVPEVEMKKLGLNIIALAFASNKFAGRAPEDKVVVRAFLGGSKHSAILAKDDDELTRLALRDIRQLLGYQPRAVPQYSRVHRWSEAMPQFLVGHRDLLAQIDQSLGQLPGLALAGASYRGVGLPECVHSGELSAEKILTAFTGSQLVV
jgi:protoporphyrinogen/coproporphyrinogen III oxidase